MAQWLIFGTDTEMAQSQMPRRCNLVLSLKCYSLKIKGKKKGSCVLPLFIDYACYKLKRVCFHGVYFHT
jgi:hypothetical protein